MPPVLGPCVAVEDALVVLRRGERQRVLAVDEGEEARFLALQELLDHDLGAGGAERAAEAVVDGLAPPPRVSPPPRPCRRRGRRP